MCKIYLSNRDIFFGEGLYFPSILTETAHVLEYWITESPTLSSNLILFKKKQNQTDEVFTFI